MQADEKQGLSLFQQAEIAWAEAGNLSSYGSQVRRIEQALRQARQEGREEAAQVLLEIGHEKSAALVRVLPTEKDSSDD